MSHYGDLMRWLRYGNQQARASGYDEYAIQHGDGWLLVNSQQSMRRQASDMLFVNNMASSSAILYMPLFVGHSHATFCCQQHYHYLRFVTPLILKMMVTITILMALTARIRLRSFTVIATSRCRRFVYVHVAFNYITPRLHITVVGQEAEYCCHLLFTSLMPEECWLWRPLMAGNISRQYDYHNMARRRALRRLPRYEDRCR